MSETSEQFRERMRREIKPVALRGVLGWGNRKGGYEAYGPDGRWGGPDQGDGRGHGDLLGDALEQAGAHEGATLLVIAVDRFGDTAVLDQVESLLAGVAAGPQATPDQVLWEGETVYVATQPGYPDDPDISVLQLYALDCPPGTHVRVVAVPTGDPEEKSP